MFIVGISVSDAELTLAESLGVILPLRARPADGESAVPTIEQRHENFLQNLIEYTPGSEAVALAEALNKCISRRILVARLGENPRKSSWLA